MVLPRSAELSEFLKSDQFQTEIQDKLKSQYEVDVQVRRETTDTTMASPTVATAATEATATEKPNALSESLLLLYTRNNAGGLKDAIDFLIARLVAHGLDASTVKASAPRPKSDSFEDNLPFFDSKLLQNAPPPVVTESAIKPVTTSLVEESGERSIFDRLRKPGSISSISSFLERRKNNQSNSAAAAAGGSVLNYGSSNGSRASLVSIESQSSAYYRNPWNDSGVNLPEEDHHHQHHQHRQQQQHLHQQQQQQQQQVQYHTSGVGSNGGVGAFLPPSNFWPGGGPAPAPAAAAPAPSAGGGGGPGGGNRPNGKTTNPSSITAGEGLPMTTTTTRYDVRASFDSGRPSTSQSMMRNW